MALAVLAGLAAGDERRGALHVQDHGGDRFVGADSAWVSTPVPGDLIAAGGDLRLDAKVAGDVIAAGGTVRLGGAAAQNVYAAGGLVALEGTVARNARVAGGSVSVAPEGRIEGNASLAGGRVEMRGAIGGYLQVAGGRVLIDGPVGGDVEATAGELELGPRARVTGRLTYRGRSPLRMDPQARIGGAIERLEIPPGPVEGWRRAAPAALAAWTAGLMLLAAVLVGVLPGLSGRLARTARSRFGWSLLVGFLALVAGPPLIVLGLMTVIGVPLALLAVLVYLALLLLGYVSAGIALGQGLLDRWATERAPRTGWRAAAAALAVLAITAATLLPWLGALVALLALVTGMGALLLLQLDRREARYAG